MSNEAFFENSKSSLIENLDELKAIHQDENLTTQKKSLQIRSKLSKLSDSKFTIIEEMFLELEIDYRTQVMSEQLDKLPPITKRAEKLIEIIEDRFQDTPELKDILVASVPDQESLRRWVKRSSWKEEIEKRMRDDSLFSPEKRHKMIDAVYKQGLKGNAKFAEMYLKMSGDIGKPVDKDPVENAFEKITKSLQKKNNE